MKSIILPIHSKWLEKILNGEKTMDVRKTKPNCELPVKVYIYCTKNQPYLQDMRHIKKNGTEIFEGDIVKFYFRYGANHEKCVDENLIVKWDDKFCSYEFSKSKWDACFIAQLKNDFEIIGNIHDNPELLEVNR